MKEQMIINSAPKGATHYDEIYLKKVCTDVFDCWYRYNHELKTWCEYQYLYRLSNIRSLADVSRIAKLEGQVI